MNLLKTTKSLCRVCAKEINAAIYEIDGKAHMSKWCLDHGWEGSVIENDSDFYIKCMPNSSKGIYDGTLIDVTYKCNLRCKWCFQDLSGRDVDIDNIMAQARELPAGYLVILSGGEPTLHKDLAPIVTELAENHPVNILTNGYKIDWSLPCEWVLSYHHEGQTLYDKAVETARSEGRKFKSIIFTTDNIEEYKKFVDQCLTLTDVAENFRIHIASPVGADTGKENNKIFISNMIKALEGYDVRISPDAKINYTPVTVNGVLIMLILWADASTIDLEELKCPPYYQGEHLVTKLIKRGIK